MSSIKRPRISANKLGEYIKSSPFRRREIVRNQKYPKGFVVTRYNDAKATIIDYFLNQKGDKDQVERKIKSLIQKSYASPFRNQDNSLSIKALEIFQESKTVDLVKYEVRRYSKDLDKLVVEGVEISVEPEIIIRGAIRGVEFIGAVKIHLSKNHPLDSETGKYVATLLKDFLERNHPKKNVKPDFCISLDIFTGKYFTAPRAFKSLRKDIEAACYEIKLLWESL